MFWTHGHVYILPKMGSWVLTRDQVFSESRLRYGFHMPEFREQKSGLVLPLVDILFLRIDMKILKKYLHRISHVVFWDWSPLSHGCRIILETAHTTKLLGLWIESITHSKHPTELALSWKKNSPEVSLCCFIPNIVQFLFPFCNVFWNVFCF